MVSDGKVKSAATHSWVFAFKVLSKVSNSGILRYGVSMNNCVCAWAFDSDSKRLISFSRAADRLALLRDLEAAAAGLEAARPTAVNLAWAVRRQLRVAAGEELESADDVRHALLVEAQRLADEDVALNRRMGFYGAELIADGDTILHHCNTGA